MKVLKFLASAIFSILYVFMIVWEILGYLILPVLFVLIGLWNKFSWQYYAVTVGGYFAILLLIDIVIRILFKLFDKKYSSAFERKLEKIFDRFFEKNDTDNHDQTEKDQADKEYINFD